MRNLLAADLNANADARPAAAPRLQRLVKTKEAQKAFHRRVSIQFKKTPDASPKA